MRQVQVKDVELSSIRFDAKLLNARETQDLALFFKAHTIGSRIPSLVAVGEGYEVIVGDSTVAAFIVNGKRIIRARIWEGTEADIDWLRTIDALRRSTDAQAWHDAAVDLIDFFQQIVASTRRDEGVSNKPRPQGGGRPKTSRGEARQLAAELLGVTTEALRKAEDRARHRTKVPTKEDVWGLECYGHACPDDVLASAKVVHYHLQLADGLLRKAQTEIAKLESSSLNQQLQQSIYNDVKETAQSVRYAKPYALCPYCKAVPGPREACGSCLGDGWSTKGVYDGAPETIRTQAVVVFGGQYVHMSTLKVVSGRGLGLDGFRSIPRFDGDSLEVESEPPREWEPESVIQISDDDG